MNMTEFILKDNYQEPNGEKYDYLVKLYDTDLLHYDIIKEIREFICNIEAYEDCVTAYLKDFLDNKGIKYEIIPIKDITTIEY